MPRHRLVHGDRRGEHAGMGVGHGQDLEHALDAAVLAVLAVQRVEHDVGPAAGRRPQEIDQRPQVALHVVLDDRRGRPRAGPRRRPCRSPARPRARATSRPSGPRRVRHRSAPSDRCSRRCGGFPSRSSTPLFSKHAAAHFLAQRSRCRRRSRRRVLIRKLQCFSETWAPPMRRPRQPARSISSHALWSGRIGEGRAAGAAARLGFGARRIDLGDAPRDGRSGRPAPRAGGAEVKIQSSGALLWR